MKKVIIILNVIALIVGSCGQQTKENVLETSQDTTLQIPDNNEKNYTVEDTVRYQIGGKLYGLTISQSDSITVIKTFYYKPNNGELYREYHFIVHNRYSYAHRYFETTYLDTIYNSVMIDEDFLKHYEKYLKPKLDTIQSEHIVPAIKDFNGYWVALKKYNDNYYIDDAWAWHPSFLIADSILTIHNMDGLDINKILTAVSLSKNGISISYNNSYEDKKVCLNIEVVDKSKSIYRYHYGQIDYYYYITPAKAIHNFEIIQYTNNTGDLLD